jgi:hypothetical protein
MTPAVKDMLILMHADVYLASQHPAEYLCIFPQRKEKHQKEDKVEKLDLWLNIIEMISPFKHISYIS